MLLKLAIQNIRRSKGYFIAYMVTVAIFFTIIYQVTNIEVQLNDYLISDIKMSQINIVDTFKYLKMFLYVIVLFFAAYISRFFIKRRSKEVALLKTLGLNRRNIWYIFLIENTIIVVVGFALGIIFGVITSRLTAMIAFDMMGMRLLEQKMALLTQGVTDVAILALITYIIISLIPLRTIAKSSIIELFNDQVKGDEIKRKPLVSTILFVIFTIPLIYQIFVSVPKSEFFETKDVLIYFVNAIFVAWFLYKGPVSYFFINYREKKKGLKSPIKMLSFNHLGSKIGSVSRMMSFITIISATLIAILIFTFGMMNKMEDIMTGNDENNTEYKTPNLQFYADSKDAAQQLRNSIEKSGEKVTSYSAYSFGRTKIEKGDEPKVLSSAVLVIKESDYRKSAKVEDINPKQLNNKVLIHSNGNPDLNAKENKYLKKTVNYLGNSISGIEFSENRFPINVQTYIDENTDVTVVNKGLQSKVVMANIVVVPDNNKIFSKLKPLEVIHLNNQITKANAFSLFDIVFKDSNISEGHAITSDDSLIALSLSYIVIGLFQIIFLMAAIVMTIALMMAIFFRTLENLESSINDYVIAKQVGMKRGQVAISIFIEAFTTQLSPFIVGGAVSILMFNQLVANRLPGLKNVLPLITEGSTATILISLGALLLFLLVVLMYIVLKQINGIKAIKAE